MRTTIDKMEDDNGGAVEMQDNGDGRKCLRWRQATDNRGGGDAGQRGKWRHRYGRIDTSAKGMRDRKQKRCGTM